MLVCVLESQICAKIDVGPVFLVPFCQNCGSQVAEGIKFCQNCGAPVEAPIAAIYQVGQSELIKPKSQPTKAWYLVPFFFSVLGGIIGYLAVRNKNRRMANHLLVFGVAMFVLGIAATILFWQ